jgi:bifunctional N-acetylglucosamine-1-phosphate-uridyltransferase/glucosamine-1-phosphate-acetyltransferase GlmU-like protein
LQTWLRVMPEAVTKPLLRRMLNRVLHSAARALPGSVSLRPALHRWRGALVGRNVFIGDEVYLENEYPECIEIGDSSEIGLRTVILAHLRGPGRVVIGRNVWIGPCCLIASAHGRTLTIGDGAVIAGACVITADVAEGTFVRAPVAAPAGIARVPLATSTYQQFLLGLRPIRNRESPQPPEPGNRSNKRKGLGF